MSLARANSTPVGLLGWGARTAVGNTAASSACAVRAAISGFADHPFMIALNGLPMLVAMNGDLDPDTTGPERLAALGLDAAREALQSAFGESGAPKLDLVVGLPTSRPGLPDDIESQLAERFRAELGADVPIGSIEFLRNGHAAGLLALEAAARRVSSGESRVCLAGAVDSYIEPDTLEWLDEKAALHTERRPWAAIPGEAGAFCVLGPRSADAVPELTAFAHAQIDPTAADDPALGWALTHAFRWVLATLPEDVVADDLICDLNGETSRANEFAYSIVRTSDRFVDSSVFTTPADCVGDIGAASGPLYVQLAAIAAAAGTARGPHTLVATSSTQGDRVAAIVRCPVAERRV